MRQYFQLCSKVLGTFLVASGMMATLVVVPLIIYEIWFSPILIRGWFLFSICYSGLSIVPIAVGFYLMQSENFFVRYCYPLEPRTPEDETLPPSGDERDNKYAPPGFTE